MYLSNVMTLIIKKNNNSKAENCTLEKKQDVEENFYYFIAKREKSGTISREMCESLHSKWKVRLVLKSPLIKGSDWT